MGLAKIFTLHRSRVRRHVLAVRKRQTVLLTLERLEDRTTPSSVTHISPASGPTGGGGGVEIDGSGFTGATVVSFGGTNAMNYSVTSDTVIMAQAPGHAAGVVDILVTAPSGTSAANPADQYTYQAPAAPVVTAVRPASGPTAGGGAVEIDGSGFTGASVVSFRGAAAPNYSIMSDTVIMAQAPGHAAGVVDVTVTKQGVTSNVSSADQYSYVASPPVVTGLSPSSGSTAGGESVEIDGSGFTGASSVSFGGVSVSSFRILADTEIIVQAPAQAAGVVDVVVSVQGAVSALVAADQYTYAVPSLRITNNPTAGNVNISQMAGSQAEESIAINPTAPNHLFVASNVIGQVGLFAATLDRTGGNTAWVGRIIADGEPAFVVGSTPAGSGDSLPRADSDPSVAYDQFGNLFLTYVTGGGPTIVSQVGLTTSLAAFNAPNTLTDTNHTWAIDEWKGCHLQITDGPGSGPTVYTISSNTANRLIISGTWPVGGTPDVGSKYIILLPQRRVVLADSIDNGKTFQFFDWAALGATGATEASVDQPTVTTGPGTTLQAARNNAGYGPTTLTDNGAAWTVNQWAGQEVVITTGVGAGQIVTIASNTTNTLTLAKPWNTLPDAESQYIIRTGAASVWVSWGFQQFNPITQASDWLVAVRGAAVDGLGVFGAFQAPVTVADSVGGEHADPKVGPSGQLLVTYQTDVNAATGLATIYVARLQQGLGSNRFAASAVATHTHVGLQHYKLPAAGNRYVDAEPTLAWDLSGLHHPGTDGRVYLVYTEVNPRTDQTGKLLFPNDTAIMVCYSNDSGQNWSAPQQANDRNGNSQFLPAAAVDPTTGWLAITWYDARNDPNNILSQIYGTVASGTLNGNLQLSFLPDVKIGAQPSSAAASGDNFGFGDYTGLAFYNKSFFPAWADNSNSTGNNPGPRTGALPSGPMDVYTAEVDVAAVQPPAPPPAPPPGAGPAPGPGPQPSSATSPPAPSQPVVSPALADSTASAPGGVAVPTDSLRAAAAAAGLDEAAAPPPAVGFPSVASLPPPAPALPQPGLSESQQTTTPGGANDLAFQLLSADLNPRIELLWPLQSATGTGDFDTDPLGI